MTSTKVPQVQGAFADLQLRPHTRTAIQRLGWTEPTPIQSRVIPFVLAGKDVVGQAQTGSGKTGAFAIPIVDRLEPTVGALQAVVLTPTRELAVQVSEDVRNLGRDRRIRVVALFGGQAIGRQIDELRRHPQVAVATPGRLLDHMQRGTVRLDALRVAVLDEADRMLDMGFLPDVSRILRATPGGRQTVLFSATMPEGICAIARQQMQDPVWIRIAAPAPTVATVTQFYVEVAEEDKVRALRRLLRRERIEAALVFRRTQHRAERLARVLQRDHRVGVLHGGMRQGARLAALRAFEARRTPLLVATNVASRGLDLPAVSHVINFDMPEDTETYIHRVGRTARAGRAGTAITFVGQHDVETFDELKRRLGDALRPHPLDVYGN
ncbi:MAG: DEAD/DEAH box helicase [Armatimonadota bacterium]|nr:DEAD/DEAH box helicase [Armatimonadota bacterium]MDR5697921.1 DEAD/DEAH box helicase [Armatimonadota bacterium]